MGPPRGKLVCLPYAECATRHHGSAHGGGLHARGLQNMLASRLGSCALNAALFLGECAASYTIMTARAAERLSNRRMRCCLLLLMAVVATGCRLLVNDRSDSLAQCQQLTQRGLAALDQGDITAADQFLRAAIAACKDSPEALSGYAELLRRRGEPEQALVQLEAALVLAPQDAALVRRRAELLLALGRLSEARAAAERALDMEPRSVEAWVLLGRVYEQANQPQQAVACWHRALGLVPEHRGVLAAMANLYWRQREPRRSLSYLYALLHTYAPKEEPAELHFQIGQCYAALQRPLEASESFALAHERGLMKAELFAALAEAHLEAGRPAQAKWAAKQALALDPADQQAQRVWQRLAALDNAESLLR